MSPRSVERTPWKSVWLDTLMQGVLGAQFGIYMLITWPYFMEIDSGATTTFLGFIVSAHSLGAAIFNPLYGVWTQNTLSTRKPVTLGYSIAFVGNLLYILAPLLPNTRWALLAARFIIGCGAGCLTSLQAYISNASTPKDRLRAVSYSSAGFSLGIMLGPAIPSVFTFLPSYNLGAIILDTYTLSSIFMMLLCAICIVVVNTLFDEDHAGIMSEQEKISRNVVLPRIDYLALVVCFYSYFLGMGIMTAIESTQTPLTIALYEWSNKDSVRYNAIITTVSCMGDLITYSLLSRTRIGKLDRRIQLAFGMAAFALFYFLHIPWPIYEQIHDNRNASAAVLAREYSGEKCFERYSWCGISTRLPVWLYFTIMIILLPIAFPLIIAATNTLVSEIVGPRKQGVWQGINSFSGSVGQTLAPMASTAVFEATGYLWMTVAPLVMCLVALGLYTVFYNRLVPLKVQEGLKEKDNSVSGLNGHSLIVNGDKPSLFTELSLDTPVKTEKF